jgi:general secretion pathway protein E
MDSTLEQMVTEQAGLSPIRQYALQTGWRPLRLSGAEKIAAGVTTFEEVFGVVSLESARSATA